MTMITVSELDERDRAIVAECLTARGGRELRPETGDWIRFSDGVEARIAYCWRDDTGWTDNAQTADPPNGGSFHLGEYGCSYSGSLDHGVKLAKLEATDKQKVGRAWIFHHGWARAGGAVDFQVLFPVWAYAGPYEDAR